MSQSHPESGAALFIHASALIVGERGIVIRGHSRSGKTSLALALVFEANRSGCFARLVGDDRIGISRRGDVLVARPHAAIAGLVERRGIGIVPVPFEAACVVRLVIDLRGSAETLERVPEPGAATATLAGLQIPCLALRSPPNDLMCHTVLAQLTQL